jgi:hypothetical protein
MIVAGVVALASCKDSGTLPGTVTLTVKAKSDCVGIADTIDVRVNDVAFATVYAGGDSFSKDLSPMHYSITASSRNGAKTWSQSKDLLSSYTFECGCQ